MFHTQNKEKKDNFLQEIRGKEDKEKIIKEGLTNNNSNLTEILNPELLEIPQDR